MTHGCDRVINFDNNATTDLTCSVKTGLVDAIEVEHGNPSSENPLSRHLRHRLQVAREQVSGLIGANSDEVYFVSGATEANNLVIGSVAARSPGAKLVSTTVEHPSVLKAFEHWGDRSAHCEIVPVGSNGRVNLSEFEQLINADTALISVQWVNNETGVIQPIEEIGRIAANVGVPLHVDAAQAVGRMPIDLSSLPISYLSMSGHKLHAPAGIGALYVKQGAPISPRSFGGDQEQGLRPGTENWLGIIGLGRAAQDRADSLGDSVNHLNEVGREFERRICARLPWVEIVGSDSPRVGNTSNVFFKGVDAQVLAIRLNEAGLLCSQSSACHTQRPEPSHVLRAMGFTEEDAYSCIRFSFSIMNTLDEVTQAVEMISSMVETLKQFGRG